MASVFPQDSTDGPPSLALPGPMKQDEPSSAEATNRRHRSSAGDRRFVADVEAGRIAPDAFDHRAHLRLAYTCLTEHPGEEALPRIRSALLGFLGHHGVDPTKYHETLTRAWFLAVRHFMALSGSADSADAFIDAFYSFDAERLAPIMAAASWCSGSRGARRTGSPSRRRTSGSHAACRACG